MPRNINFLLNELLFDESYVPTGGNTEPSIIFGLFGNVTFEPWTGFKQIIQDANDVVERLDDEQLTEAKNSLHQARKFIRRKRKTHLAAVRLELEGKALYECQGATGSGTARGTTNIAGNLDDNLLANNDGGSAPNEGFNVVALSLTVSSVSESSDTVHSAEVEPEIKESASKKAKLGSEPWTTKKPVTSSTSISNLHGNVIDALDDLLAVMYPEETLDFDQKLISSENVVGTASEKMIHQHMLGVMKQMNMQIPAQGDLQKDKRAGENTQAEARKEVGGSQPVRGDVDEGPTGSLEQLKGEPPQSSDGIGAEGQESAQQERGKPVRRSLGIQERAKKGKMGLSSRGERKRDVFVPAKPVIKLNQTPDRSLFCYTLSDHGLVPVCSYEFKGPTLDLSGLASAESTSPEDMMALHGQYQPMAGSSEPNMSESPDIESAEGQDREEDIYKPGLSARAVAAEYNRLFSQSLHMNKQCREFSEERTVLLPIAQVICHALLTQTGCVFLTNHQTAFALMVVEDPAADSFRARVFVTGAIPCNREPGQFAAMLGFTKYCLDILLAQPQQEELLNPQRRLLMSLSYFAYHAEYDMEPLDKDWVPGDNQEGPGTGRGSQSGTGASRTMNQSHHATDSTMTHQVDAGFTCYEVYQDGEFDKAHTPTDISSSSESSRSTASFEDGTALVRAGDMHKPARSVMDEHLKALFSATEEGVLSVGGSGVLYRGVWDGTKVAVMMWNGQSREGFLNFRREIKVFTRLQKKCPYVLGSVVPRFLVGWDSPHEYSVYRKQLILLTEWVGNEIAGGRDGSLWMKSEEGVEMLMKSDRSLICKAALSSLEELHKNRFLRGDIALRNMRIMRKL